jgi:hypothetical protein
MKRSDPHSPANMVREDYEYYSHVDLKSDDPGYVPEFPHHIAEPFKGHFWERGGCDHCGKRSFRYGAVFVHNPTGEYIVVGHACATNAFGYYAEWARNLATLMKEAKGRREKLATLERANYLAKEHGLLEVFAHADPNGSREAQILVDLHNKLGRYGLSEKQIEFAKSLAERIENPPACPVCGDTSHDVRECPNKGEAPESDGRIEVEGVVVSWRDEAGWGYDQTVIKGLIRLDNGAALWGTLSTAVIDGEDGQVCMTWDELRGKRVRFTARVNRSDRDPSFGFFKRPTKWERVG